MAKLTTCIASGRLTTVKMTFVILLMLQVMGLTSVLVLSDGNLGNSTNSLILPSSGDEEKVRGPNGKKKGVIPKDVSVQSDLAPPTSPYAYFFLVGGVDEYKPSYKGFLYSVLVSVHILRRLGSLADFVLRVQISPNSTLTALPEADSRPLLEEGVRIQSTRKSIAGEGQSFGQLMQEKLWMLNMTDYRRVAYLDADLMPLVNLDYLFRLSDVGKMTDKQLPVLRPNFILASRGEPCNGGLVVLEPGKGKLDQMLRIIEGQLEQGARLPYPHFHRSLGWGHDFSAEGDKWESIKSEGRKWNYHGSHVDQGLLYYWVKYVVQDTSIAIGNRLQNWIPGDDGKPRLLSESIGVLQTYSSHPLTNQTGMDHLRFSPYRDFVHFMGGNKPWQRGPVNKSPTSRLWFDELATINSERGLGLDVAHWNAKHRSEMHDSPLGTMPMYKDLAKLYVKSEEETPKQEASK